ncbi:hypothetical protein FS837_006667 [Tulasnella sp. UAMH 9824]|nr:hypothetical protein FS837_006667 [Tulasnella sp. UAMH 9824]
MSAFVIIRAIFFALFILINGAVLASAAVNLTASPEPAIRSLDIYLIFYSTASILFMFPLILVDVLRRGAVMSTVRFECIWLLFSWILNLCGASASTALVPTPSCKQSSADSWCSSARTLIPVTWAATGLVMAYLLLLVVTSLVYTCRHPEVWTTAVRDFQWFNGGGNSKSEKLPSLPPSPAFVPRQLTLNANPTVTHLERMAETWQPPHAPPMTQVRVQPMTASRPTEPQPLTLANAPELPPTRAPVHYTASAVVSVGVLPGRRPSGRKNPPAPAQAPPAPAQPALYPSYVQAATSTPKRTPTAPETITFHSPRSSQLQGSFNQTVSDEPLPIQNWPRVNPQQPLRKNRTSNTPVVPSMQTQVVPLSTPGPAPASSAPTNASPHTRRTSSPRRRPPPLDLSAAMPVRVR